MRRRALCVWTGAFCGLRWSRVGAGRAEVLRSLGDARALLLLLPKALALGGAKDRVAWEELEVGQVLVQHAAAHRALRGGALQLARRGNACYAAARNAHLEAPRAAGDVPAQRAAPLAELRQRRELDVHHASPGSEVEQQRVPPLRRRRARRARELPRELFAHKMLQHCVLAEEPAVPVRYDWRAQWQARERAALPLLRSHLVPIDPLVFISDTRTLVTATITTTTATATAAPSHQRAPQPRLLCARAVQRAAIAAHRHPLASLRRRAFRALFGSRRSRRSRRFRRSHRLCLSVCLSVRLSVLTASTRAAARASAVSSGIY
mmetsp:Transcript_7862/g.20802  ORF Transcript_7862/g.20802 Transcript_7862/m.20802 type:complete len:321 (-) Transcript_7862:1462-2424(-)